MSRQNSRPNAEISLIVFAYNSAFQLEVKDAKDKKTGKDYKHFNKKTLKDPNGVFSNTTLEMPFMFGNIYIDQPEKLFQGAKHCVNHDGKNPNPQANPVFFKRVVETVVDEQNEAFIQNTFSDYAINPNPIFNSKNQRTYEPLIALEFMTQIEHMRFSQYDNHELISILKSMRKRDDQPLSKVLENKCQFIEDCPRLSNSSECRDPIWGALFDPSPFGITGENLQGLAILQGLRRVLQKQEEEGKKAGLADPYSQIYPVTQFYVKGPFFESVDRLNSLGTTQLNKPEQKTINPHKSFRISPTACYKGEDENSKKQLTYFNPINANPTYNRLCKVGAKSPFEAILQQSTPIATSTTSGTRQKPTGASSRPSLVPPATPRVPPQPSGPMGAPTSGGQQPIPPKTPGGASTTRTTPSPVPPKTPSSAPQPPIASPSSPSSNQARLQPKPPVTPQVPKAAAPAINQINLEQERNNNRNRIKQIIESFPSSNKQDEEKQRRDVIIVASHGIAEKTRLDYEEYKAVEKFSLSSGSIFKQALKDDMAIENKEAENTGAQVTEKSRKFTPDKTKTDYLYVSQEELIEATNNIKNRSQPSDAGRVFIDASMMLFRQTEEKETRDFIGKGQKETRIVRKTRMFSNLNSGDFQELGPQGLAFADFNNLTLSDYDHEGNIIKMFKGVDITGASFNNCDISGIDFSEIGPSLENLQKGSAEYNEAVAAKKAMFESLQFGGNCLGLDQLTADKIPFGAKIKTSAIVTKYKDGSQVMSAVNIDLMENPNDFQNPKSHFDKPVDNQVKEGLRLSEERLRPSSSPTPNGQAQKLAAQAAQAILAS